MPLLRTYYGTLKPHQLTDFQLKNYNRMLHAAALIRLDHVQRQMAKAISRAGGRYHITDFRNPGAVSQALATGYRSTLPNGRLLKLQQALLRIIASTEPLVKAS